MSALVLAVARIRSPSTLTCNKMASGGGDALGSGGVELGAADGLTDAPGVGEASEAGRAPKAPITSPTARPTSTTAPTAPATARRGCRLS
jgi:hypothetical protein